MKWPPYLMSLRIHDFELWIPLFILAPAFLAILLAVVLIALPFLLVAFIFTWNIMIWRWLWFGIRGLFSVLHSLPGTKIDIDDRKERISIAIY
jgi:hypothetical protein